MMRFVSRWRLGKSWSFPSPTPPCPPLSRGGAVALGLVLAIALAAAAQDGAKASNDARLRERPGELAQFVEVADSAEQREREMAEDMAVMGKLVDQSLAAVYERASTATCLACHVAIAAQSADVATMRRAFFDTTRTLPEKDVASALALLLGQRQRTLVGSPSLALFTYLEGYGVVYQLEAAAPAVESEKAEQAQAKCPFLTHSPWERAQLELRGQWKTEDCQECHAAQQRQSVQTFNNMDQYRIEVDLHQHRAHPWWPTDTRKVGPHGERAAVPTREQLVNALVGVLAENGHNFRHLAPQERVAVAMSLRARAEMYEHSYQIRGAGAEGAGAAGEGQEALQKKQDSETKPEDSGASGKGEAQLLDRPQQDPGGGTTLGDFDNDGHLDLLFSGPQGNRILRNLGNGRFQDGGVSAFDDDNDGLLDLSVNQGQPTTQELTGDLYMRQRNYAAAVQSYEKALQEAARIAPEGAKDSGAQSRLYSKLIQALVAARRFDVAMQLLDVLSGAVKPTPPDQAHKPAQPPAPRLPARLVVSATKAQLDAVHGGAMSRDEFAKQVTVQFVDPNPRPGKGAKGEGGDSARD